MQITLTLFSVLQSSHITVEDMDTETGRKRKGFSESRIVSCLMWKECFVNIFCPSNISVVC